MPSQVERHVVRIAFDLANPGKVMVDKLTGTNPQIWRGNDVRFEVVVMRNGAVLDVGNLASLTLEARLIDDLDGTPQMQKTVASGAMDNTVTDPTWVDNTKQHATFDFSDTETNLTSPGDDYGTAWQRNYFLVLSGLTSGGSVITYGFAEMIFREDGAGSAGAPPTNDPNYYTQAQTDAGFVQKTGATMTGLLVLSADPGAALGAATKQYVDAASANGGFKQPVRAASTANVDIASAPAAIDGVTLANGDRVLLKDQTSGLQNGIRVFTAAAAALNRSGDANSSALVKGGLAVFVNEGTVNADRTFKLTTNDAITLDTTALVFTQTSALGQVTVPAGTTKTTNELLAWHASAHATPAGIDVTTTGGAALPAISRSGDLNTGLDFPAADTIIAATAGVERARITDTGLGIHMTPTKALDVTGEAAVSSRVTALGFETTTPGVQVLDAQVATIAANNLPFPSDGQILQVAAGTVNTVSNVRAGALYLIVATGAVTLTDSATVVCRDGNVVLAADEAVMALGLSPTKVAIIGQTNGHRVASGSAAAPTIFFDAETTTGLFRSAAGLIGLAFSGVERAKLGASGNDFLINVPDYNFVLDPSSNTVNRGNLNLFGAAGYGGGSGVIALPMQNDVGGTYPTVATATDLLIAAEYDNSLAPALHLKCNTVNHVLGGGRVSFFDTFAPFGAGQPYTFSVRAGSAGFYSDALTQQFIESHGDTASWRTTLVLQRSRGTRASPNATQSADELSRVETEGRGSASYHKCFRQDVIAAEAFGAAAAGVSVVWSSCPLGSATLTERLKLDGLGNWLFHGIAAPTTMAKGIGLGDGTAATANPSSGVAVWAVSGALQYRSSVADEGAGQTNHVHNRASQIVGVGTDYTLTGATARVDFGTTDAEVVLPTAGTYLVSALVAITNGATATDNYVAKLYNTTDAADVASSQRQVSAAAASQKLQISLQNVITITAAKTLQIYAHNSTAARGTVISTETSISYVRLH